MGYFTKDRACCTILAVVLLCCNIAGEANGADVFRAFSDLPKEKKVLAVNAGGALLITAWGIINWDYGQRRPHAQAERWFSENTGDGGVDKVAHFYNGHVLTRVLSSIYKKWGYEKTRAAWLGFLSSCGILFYMELGDSFSDYGFSYEDLIANLLGSGFGYFLNLHPEVAKKIDLRVEIKPTFKKLDIFTDYDRQKYLLALKLDGFDSIRGPLSYLELHAGYYTRGYSEVNKKKERNVYVGIGVNLSKIFSDFAFHKTSAVLHYLQVPYTSIQFRKDLNN